MRQVVIITGKTGYGKSTWLEAYSKGVQRIAAFDPFAKFPAEYLTEDELIKLSEIQPTGPFRIATHRLDDLDLIGSLSYLLGNCLLVIEECGYCFGKGERIPDWLSEIVFLGRHNNVSLVVTAQRAASIPIDLRSQANRLVTFQQTETNDIGWMDNYLPPEADVTALDRFECYDSEDNNVSRYKVTKSM
jgi:hypothetical protein